MTEHMKLIQGYLDGRLTPEQLHALQLWINANKENARVFARHGLLHSHIRDKVVEKDLQESLDCSGLAHANPMDTDVVGTEVMLEPIECDQDRVKSIKQYAEHQLQAFLEEQEKLNPAPKPVTNRLRRFTLDWARTGRKMADIMSVCARTAAGLAILTALVLTITVAIIALRPKPVVVATIAEAVQAQWAEPPTQALLYPGPMTLEEGFVRLDFKNGAQVIVKAPATFNLEAADRMYLQKGRLVARAEDRALGFTVRTPYSSVVDFGTEFGVWVDNRRGRSEAHVFEGQVELRCGSNPKRYNASRRLNVDQACSADARGKLSSILPARPLAFVRHVPSAYELAVLDSRPIAYWRFDLTSPTTLSNASNPQVNAGHYAGPVQFTDGPDLGKGKKALAMQCDGQHTYASIEGMVVPEGHYTTGYTHVAWIRADAIRQQSVLSTCHSNDLTGGRRVLAMTAEGRFEHSLISENSKSTARVVSKTVAQLGQWYHVVVLRSAHDDRKLFVNGVEEDVAELSHAGAPRFQDVACLGSLVSDIKNPKQPLFKGALSDVVLYNRALTAEEIRSLYRAAQQRDMESERSRPGRNKMNEHQRIKD
jgi:hypothetical protein